MQVPAIKITQNGRTFYMCKFKAKELLRLTKIDVWSPQNPLGYQRTLNTQRARAFMKYILKPQNISPTSIVVASRSEVKFVPTKKGEDLGYLVLNEQEKLFVVDGQHRIGGIRYAVSEREAIDVSFSVILLPLQEWGIKEEDECRFEEAKQFVIINRTQKTVRADLADQFIKRLPPDRRIEIEGILLGPQRLKLEILADKITDVLSKKSPVWKDKIRYPNEKKSAKPVSWKSFKDSLLSILKSEWGQNVISLQIKEENIVDEISHILDNYWIAWKEQCIDAFMNPQDYVIQKTTGVFVLHYLFPTIATFLENLGKNYTPQEFLSLIQLMDKGVSSNFWYRGGEAGKIGTSQKAFRRLAKDLEGAFYRGIYKYGIYNNIGR